MSAPIEWTWWSSPTDPNGLRAEADDWGTLVAMLRQHARRPHDGRAWSPVTFEGNRRSAATVERVFAVGMDVDVDGEPGRVADALRGLAAFVHTTRKHRPEAPRCRAIVPLAQPTDAEGYKRAWHALAARLERAGVEVDQSAKDASRLWFLPSLPAEGEPTVLVLEGSAMPVPLPELDVAPTVAPMARPPVRVFSSRSEADRVLEAAARWLSRAEPAVAGQHGHDRTYVVARKLIHGFELPPEAALGLLRQWNRHCVPPWSEAALRRKVDQAAAAATRPERARVLELVGGGR